MCPPSLLARQPPTKRTISEKGDMLEDSRATRKKEQGPRHRGASMQSLHCSLLKLRPLQRCVCNSKRTYIPTSSLHLNN